jgi:hypothetical protein
MSDNGNGSHEFDEHVWEAHLPAGGRLFLRSAEELDYFDTIRDGYVADYNLTKLNDLALLGALLSQQLEVYRAQQLMNGMEPVMDADNIPTGEYALTEVKDSTKNAAQQRLLKATEEVRAIEKTLGIDKKTRESGGQYTVEEYIGTLKAAARKYGLHISRRFKRHEKFANGLRWRIRLLHNGDHEDRQYHGVDTPEQVVEWAEKELAKIEEHDKQFAKEHGALVIGKL